MYEGYDCVCVGYDVYVMMWVVIICMCVQVIMCVWVMMCVWGVMMYVGYDCVWGCYGVCVICTCHSEHMKGRGQLCGAGSLFLRMNLCGF